VLKEVTNLLQGGLKPTQIALIGPAAHLSGSLARFHEIDGRPLTTDAGEWRRGRGLLVTTARSFKGLEADAIVLYDLDGFSERFTLADLYVAWTRARHRLVIICQGREVRAEIERALAEAETPREVSD
jgi:superfamily I DNA/RNA helicase